MCCFSRWQPLTRCRWFCCCLLSACVTSATAQCVSVYVYLLRAHCTPRTRTASRSDSLLTTPNLSQSFERCLRSHLHPSLPALLTERLPARSFRQQPFFFDLCFDYFFKQLFLVASVQICGTVITPSLSWWLLYIRSSIGYLSFYREFICNLLAVQYFLNKG